MDDDEKLLSDLRQDNWNLTGRLIMARERIAELEFQNKLMKAELRKLQRVTAIDQSFNGPDKGKCDG